MHVKPYWLNLIDHKQIVVLDAPSSFERELTALEGVEIIRDLKTAKEVRFSLAFVTTTEEIDALAPAIARKTGGDAIVWFAYPKGTSKRYKSQISRDTGLNMLGREGFEPVRMVAIDEDGRKALSAGQLRQVHDTCQGTSAH